MRKCILKSVQKILIQCYREIEDSESIQIKHVLPPIKVEKKEGLRKRHEPEKKKNSEWVQTEDNNSLSDDKDEIELDEKKNKKKIKKSRDPLHWFGLFVSPSLRTSQDHFKTGKTYFLYIHND